MESPLNELVASYLADIKNRKGETPSQIEARAKRITLEHDLVFNQIVTNFDNINLSEPDSGSENIDGGSASTTYLLTQRIDGGGASEVLT